MHNYTLRGRRFLKFVTKLPQLDIFKALNVFQVRAADAVFETKVLEVNKGGAVCSAFGLKAFLPGSHFVGRLHIISCHYCNRNHLHNSVILLQECPMNPSWVRPSW